MAKTDSSNDPLIITLPADESGLARGEYTGKGAGEECEICCCGYNIKEKVIYLPCVHWYHEKCILDWIHKQQSLKDKPTCPICLKNIFQ